MKNQAATRELLILQANLRPLSDAAGQRIPESSENEFREFECDLA